MNKKVTKDRYDVSHLPEGQFEPGSRGLVLKNLLGIKRKREMDLREADEQVRAMERLFGQFNRTHRFTPTDICEIHSAWLGSLYTWAGRYRQVNVSKGDFPFASAAQIPKLMADFEEEALRRFTPCLFKSHEEVVEALATVHTELVLIHPFRDGNGRTARMLSVLMAVQAGLPPLDFQIIRGRLLQEYFAAVRAGLTRDYQPMGRIFRAVLSETMRRAEET